ncbi:hypothetical protein ABIC50_003376 [Burkholderia sp. 567]
MLDDRGAGATHARTRRAWPARVRSGVRRPFVGPGACRYRAILLRSRPVRNCHFSMPARLWFLCKRLQEVIA